MLCSLTSTPSSPNSIAARSWRASPSRSAQTWRSPPSSTASRKSPGGGPALLFEKPRQARRVRHARRREPVRLDVAHLPRARRRDARRPGEGNRGADDAAACRAGFMDALKLMPLVSRLTDLMPKTVKDAPCQEVVKMDGGLDELPILTTLARRRRTVHHAAARHHPRSGNRHAQHRHCTACRSTIAARPACTGSATRAARSTIASPNGWASASRSPSRSAPIRC